MFRQHYNVPVPSLVSEITHVAIAFMQSSVFNQENPSAWPLFTTVDEVRSKFAAGTSIMVAIGGWGDNHFAKAASTNESRQRFARNVQAMVESTGADGKASSLEPSLCTLI
jgi:GH18 family chitinase